MGVVFISGGGISCMKSSRRGGTFHEEEVHFSQGGVTFHEEGVHFSQGGGTLVTKRGYTFRVEVFIKVRRCCC